MTTKKRLEDSFATTCPSYGAINFNSLLSAKKQNKKTKPNNIKYFF